MRPKPESAQEYQQLEQSIAALEAQRSVLGAAVIDAALAPLRKRLAELTPPAAPAETPPEYSDTRKHITVLFADISGFTAMSEAMDAEDVAEVINALWLQLDDVILTHGGLIDKHIGDCVMALWGAKTTREDDPERAIRAALAMQAALTMFREARRLELAMRIGLNTGPVLLGEVGSTREFTAIGDTVNLASRLEHAAPVGGILISHTTYQHVRGIFEVVAQAPLTVKGKAEPVLTYLVHGLRPRTFLVSTRGVEGIETRLVGRDTELHRLQMAYQTVLDGNRLQIATVIAEAGVGKSRLLHEFDAWVAARAEHCRVFKGRAGQGMQALPYSLLRDMVVFRFQIQDSDPLDVVRAKMEAGVGAALESLSTPTYTTAQSARNAGEGTWPEHETPMRAHFIGHLLGFDFSDSPYFKGGLEDARQLRDRASLYLTDYFKVLAAQTLVLILLEDLHWADDSSLDMMDSLLHALSGHRLLILCAARPSLFERHPDWGAAHPQHFRLILPPLSRRDSLALVDDILQKVEAAPDTLREMVVSRAEGNPFYVEELLKMLIEDGVIRKGADRWQVDALRLTTARVPPTLTAVLQARFDNLPAPEKAILQRASIVGRTFWAETVDFLSSAEESLLTDTVTALVTLCQREMVFQNGTTTFAAAAEYIFKHTLLRDAVYESVLKRDRRIYHARAAEWLILNCGAREGEFVGLIAEHLERAAQPERAARYLARAGAGALSAYAYQAAVDYFARALALLPPDSRECIPLWVQSGEALWYLGEYAQAQAHLQAGLTLGRQHGADEHCADALIHLGGLARKQGDWAGARAYLEESLRLARRLGARSKIAHALYSLAWVDIRQGAYAAAKGLLIESRALYHEGNEPRGLADALNGLGSVALNLGEYAEARAYYLESLTLFQTVGDRPGASAALVNLGEAARRQGDYAAARQYYEESLAIDREIGDELLAALTLGNLGHTAQACGDHAAAEAYYREGVRTALTLSAIPDLLDNLAGLAGVLAHTGRWEQALTVLGTVLHHPALEDESRTIAEQALSIAQAALPPEIVTAGLTRGSALELSEVAQSLLPQQ